MFAFSKHYQLFRKFQQKLIQTNSLTSHTHVLQNATSNGSQFRIETDKNMSAELAYSWQSTANLFLYREMHVHY